MWELLVALIILRLFRLRAHSHLGVNDSIKSSRQVDINNIPKDVLIEGSWLMTCLFTFMTVIYGFARNAVMSVLNSYERQ